MKIEKEYCSGFDVHVIYTSESKSELESHEALLRKAYPLAYFPAFTSIEFDKSKGYFWFKFSRAKSCE